MTAREHAPEAFPLLTAAEMQAWDRRAIDDVGVPERLLMENAGRAVARLIARTFPEGPVVAAVGRGNNGGDALVALRTLSAWGRSVVAVPVTAAALRQELLNGWDLPIGTDLATAGASAGVLVDGMLGTGARGAPRAEYAQAVRAMNASGRTVVALDGPTGVDLTDGSMPGEAVRADLTITFGAPKRGLLLYPGRRCAGRLVTVEVGFPPLEAAAGSAAVVTAGWARARLPVIPPDAHKGIAGAVTVVAGRRGMGGAAIMVAMGALRAGAGIVRVVSEEANRTALQAAVPEAVFADRESGPTAAALESADALVAGPGMGTDPPALELLGRILETNRPVVLDADALTLLAAHPGLLTPAAGPRVLLTPHPGEMARLSGCSVQEITGDPFGAVRRSADRFGCAVLLKGAPSLVAAPGQPTLANVTGHSGIASGGMGDTLAGIAGAMIAAGAPPRDAGTLALYFSGRAAERAGRRRSLLPRDVADALCSVLDGAREIEDPLSDPEVLLDLPAPR